MGDKTKDNNLDSEIAKRLDDLFGGGEDNSDDDSPIEADGQDTAKNEPQKEQSPAAEAEILDLKEVSAAQTGSESVPDDYPLAELKNLVLSIDWEITEEALADLLSEINNLKNTYQNEKIILMFLQLLTSLGQYIKINRGNAHPKTFKILNSVYSRLEEVILAEDMSEADRKNLLRAEMQKYKQLRNKVSKNKAAKRGRKEVQKVDSAAHQAKTAEPSEPAHIASPADPPGEAVLALTPESLAEAINELKQYIHSELNALKKELEKLQKFN